MINTAKITVKLAGQEIKGTLDKPAILQGYEGKSAYQVAVENGFAGTEAQWLKTLTGPEGPKGEPGVEGPQGPKGPMGESGVFVGTSAPTDPEVNIWIDPNGITSTPEGYDDTEIRELIAEKQPKGDYALKSEIPNVSQFQTAEQVAAAINQAFSTIGIAEEGKW